MSFDDDVPFIWTLPVDGCASGFGDVLKCNPVACCLDGVEKDCGCFGGENEFDEGPVFDDGAADDVNPNLTLAGVDD